MKGAGRVKRSGIIAAGWMVLTLGVVMIPYPGPGWLVVFVGLAILSREHLWAKRLLKYSRGKYDAWRQWIAKQPFYIRSLTYIGTSVVVILTLWLVDAYGLIDKWLGLGQSWLHSPLF